MSAPAFTLCPEYAARIAEWASRLGQKPNSVIGALIGYGLKKLDEGTLEFFDIDKNEVVEGRDEP